MNIDNKGRFLKGMKPHNYGKSMSKEEKDNMENKVYSKRRGKDYNIIYGETKAKEISNKQRKAMTTERINVLVLRNKGKHLSEEHKKKLIKCHIGKKRTKETKDKIRQKLIGHQVSNITREKISKKNTGRIESEEIRREQSKRMKNEYTLGIRKPAMLGKKLSEDAKQKISDKLKLAYKEGRKSPILMIGKNNPFYGKTHSLKNIEIIREANTGERSHCWQGGKSFEPYTIDFNRKFKEAIRIRDAFVCLKCGMKEEDSLILFKRNLHIHHIDYIKENTCKENCCTLCCRCHVEANFNRNSWIKFFQSLLKERYGYKYSADREISIKKEIVD